MRYIPLLTILALTISILFSGCVSNGQPDVNECEQIFCECYDDVSLVVDYMISLEYSYIKIDYKYIFGKINVKNGDKFETADIDPSIEEPIKRLMKKYEGICRNGNTIEFQQWHRGSDIDCGIAYVFNGLISPEIQYITEAVPLSKDGWYYYVADYNLWRIEEQENNSKPLKKVGILGETCPTALT